MDTNKYIKRLILETIKANINASKGGLITESKDYSFTKKDVVEESMKREGGVPYLYIEAMDVYSTMQEASPQVLPLIAQTSNETPREFANRVFPAYKSVFDKKFIETISPGSPNRNKNLNEKLFPIYKIIHGILLEAIEFACFEFISEINFEGVYDSEDPEYLFTFDNKVFEEAKEKGIARNEYDTDLANAFHVLRDDPNYYNVKYTFSSNNNQSTPFSRLDTTFYMSPYQDFFKKNKYLAFDSDLRYGIALYEALE